MSKNPSVPSRGAALQVGDIVEAGRHDRLMFVQEVRAGSARCAWVQAQGIGEAEFPLSALRPAPAPAPA